MPVSAVGADPVCVCVCVQTASLMIEYHVITHNSQCVVIVLSQVVIF